MRLALLVEKKISQQDAIGSLVSHLIDHLEARGHSCLVLTADGISMVVGRTEVVSVHSRWQTQDAQICLHQALRNFQPDLLHVFQPGALGISAMRVGRQLGLPVLASFHSDFRELAQQWKFNAPGELMWSHFRNVHELSDLTLVPTYFQQMQLREQGFSHLQTWARGVDCDLFAPKRRSGAWRRHLSAGHPNATLLVFAGRLSHERHVELLKPVIAANPDSRLAIVGGGPEAAWLRDYFEGTPTLFTGYLDQGDLAEVLASADAFVHPATTQISSVTTLEALASGLPLLAPHSASILDIAVHGENALLFLPGDTEKASIYARALVTQSRLRADLGRVARQTALSRTWPTTFDVLTDRYKQLIDGQPNKLALPMRVTQPAEAY